MNSEVNPIGARHGFAMVAEYVVMGIITVAVAISTLRILGILS